MQSKLNMFFTVESKNTLSCTDRKQDGDRKGVCTYPGILSHSSSVNLPSYSAVWWTKPAELEVVWLLCFVRLHSLELSNISDALWRYVPKRNLETQKKPPTLLDAREGMVSFFMQRAPSGPHLGYCSLRRSLSYPRSSSPSLYLEWWRSRALSVYWSSGSLSVRPLCRSETQPPCPRAAGPPTLGTNMDSSER